MILHKVLRMADPGRLHKWIRTLPEGGRYVFTRAEAESVIEASPCAVQATLRRMKRRGLIACPRRGFYVVVPAEYRSAGCPPATWFIDDLMRHLGRHYYVALLTAAALHGAGHEQPMAFQVMTTTAERDLVASRVRIEFHASNRFKGAATTEMQTETGTMIVATAETTAFDLVRFPAASGYWSHIATVLSELAEKLDPARLVRAAERVARSDVQRLGWLLDLLRESVPAGALAACLEGERVVPVRLNSLRNDAGAVLDRRWRVRVNDDVEPDL